jgi:hypothetical protein
MKLRKLSYLFNVAREVYQFQDKTIPFFLALYKGFKILGYYGQNKIFSLIAVRELKIIKYCAILFSIFILSAGIFILLFNNKEDDPAGFISLSILTTFLTCSFFQIIYITLISHVYIPVSFLFYH